MYELCRIGRGKQVNLGLFSKDKKPQVVEERTGNLSERRRTGRGSKL